MPENYRRAYQRTANLHKTQRTEQGREWEGEGKDYPRAREGSGGRADSQVGAASLWHAGYSSALPPVQVNAGKVGAPAALLADAGLVQCKAECTNG